MKAKSFSPVNTAKLIGITGIARTGKALVGGLVASLEKVEKINVNLMWELANQLNFTKQINDESSVFLLRKGFSIISYNLALGREVNTRPNDFSSILLNKNPNTYFRRIKKAKEGDGVFKKMKKDLFKVPILIHYALLHSKIIFKAFPDIKMIQVEKNPIELSYSWINKKYGSEFYKNERGGILTFKKNKKIFPWFAYGWENLYFSLNETDKIVYLLDKLTKLQNLQYKKLNRIQKRKIIKIHFENFVSNPKFYVKKIEKFLNSKKTYLSNKFLLNEKCPRKLKKKNYEFKKLVLKKKLSKLGYKKLILMEKQYFKKLNFKKLYF